MSVDAIGPEDVDLSLVDWRETAGNLQDELRILQRIVREYVAAVDDGERFDALVSAVPGLESDDGAYPTGEVQRLRNDVAELQRNMIDLHDRIRGKAQEFAVAARRGTEVEGDPWAVGQAQGHADAESALLTLIGERDSTPLPIQIVRGDQIGALPVGTAVVLWTDHEGQRLSHTPSAMVIHSRGQGWTRLVGTDPMHNEVQRDYRYLVLWMPRRAA